MSSIASCRKISVGSSSVLRSSPSCSSYQSPVASAFWKIVGFEVTPTMESSFISLASSPVSSISRETESIHGLTPASKSSCSRDVAILHLLLHRFDFSQSLHIALAAVEARAEKGAHEVDRELGADRPRSRGRARSCRRARRPGAPSRRRGRSRPGSRRSCRPQPRRRHPSRRRGPRARRRRRGSPRPPRAPCPGSRSASRPCRCRGRPSRGRVRRAPRGSARAA